MLYECICNGDSDYTVFFDSGPYDVKIKYDASIEFYKDGKRIGAYSYCDYIITGVKLKVFADYNKTVIVFQSERDIKYLEDFLSEYLGISCFLNNWQYSFFD